LIHSRFLVLLSLLPHHIEGTKQTTKRFRYSLLSSFFNFIRNSIDPSFQNPWDSPILKKLFRHPRPKVWKILEKDVVDEIIFRTRSPKNRIMLELMARGGLRVGEVLKITPRDIED
jgi:integrase/recombinase XerD